MSDEFVQVFGRYTVVARADKAGPKSVVRLTGGAVIETFEAATVEDAFERASQRVLEMQQADAAARDGMPTVEETAQAFRRIKKSLPASYLEMLQVHYRAPDQRITATDLAAAVGWKGWGSANLHYGRLGVMLNCELPIVLPRRKDGSLIATCALASSEDQREDHAAQWLWKLHPHVAGGLLKAGLVKP